MQGSLGKLCCFWIPPAEELSLLEGWSLTWVLQLEDDLFTCMTMFSGVVQCCPGGGSAQVLGLGVLQS